MDDASRSVVALISIHPRHAEAILAGRKAVEFRRATFPSRATHVALYATSPVQRIVGVCRVAGLERAAPSAVWERHRSKGGITRKEFRSYFVGADLATAISIDQVTVLAEPLALSALEPGLTPPQSMRYLCDESGQALLVRASSRSTE